MQWTGSSFVAYLFVITTYGTSILLLYFYGATVYVFLLLLCVCRHIMTGSYNNFFRMFDRESKRDSTLEACREITKPRTVLKLRKVCTGGKRKKDEISVDCLDFNKKILHTGWHPLENIIAIAATNNLYIFCSKD